MLLLSGHGFLDTGGSNCIDSITAYPVLAPCRRAGVVRGTTRSWSSPFDAPFLGSAAGDSDERLETVSTSLLGASVPEDRFSDLTFASSRGLLHCPDGMRSDEFHRTWIFMVRS